MDAHDAKKSKGMTDIIKSLVSSPIENAKYCSGNKKGRILKFLARPGLVVS